MKNYNKLFCYSHIYSNMAIYHQITATCGYIWKFPNHQKMFSWVITWKKKIFFLKKICILFMYLIFYCKFENNRSGYIYFFKPCTCNNCKYLSINKFQDWKMNKVNKRDYRLNLLFILRRREWFLTIGWTQDTNEEHLSNACAASRRPTHLLFISRIIYR